jgi:hypothetical protein
MTTGDASLLTVPFAAISGKIVAQLGRFRHGSADHPSGHRIGKFAAKSGTVSNRTRANSYVCNILPRMRLIISGHDPISSLISTIYAFASVAPLNLTPYSAIFCKQVMAAQQLAHHPRKIFKTRNLKLNAFNILQIPTCNILKTGILLFLLFSEVFRHGRQNL